jgi:hypothetical protein
MQKVISKCFFLILFLFLYSHSFYGQGDAEKKSLSSIILSIENNYDVRFSYATENISQISIVPPDPELDLQEILNYLTINTPLVFTQINERFITINLKDGEGSICGKIVDSQTKVPLVGATIYSQDRSINTTTDSDGVFHIANNNSNLILIISYLGYNDSSINTSQLDYECPLIELQQTISELEEVILYNFLTKGIDKHFDGSITLKTNNFGLLPGQIENDVLQIIQALPGVESVNETISNINIRGGTHDESLFLWDGIKMYQNGHFFGLISAFNPKLTQDVTVYKNGTHARYGESVSGVIDMRSKNTISESFTGSVGFNLIDANAYLNIPVSDRLGIQVSGRRSLNSLLETNIYRTYAERIFQDTEIINLQSSESTVDITADEEFNFYDFSTKLLWDVSEKDQVRVNFMTIDNTLDFVENIIDEDMSLSKKSDLQQQSIVGGISWNRTWSDRIQSNAFVYGSYYVLNSLNRDIFTTQQQLQENEILDTGIKLDLSYIVNENMILENGYQFSEVGITNTQDINLPRFRSNEKDVVRTHSVFSNLNLNSNNNKTIVNVGLRVNYQGKFDKFSLEPRLSIYQKFNNEFAAEVLGEFKSQTTTQRIDFESDFLGIEKRRWVLSDDNEVPIIRSRQASIGLIYKNSGWFINLEGFYKKVTGISSANQGFQNQFQNVRIEGEYQVNGIEFSLNKKMNSFSTWLSYVYMKNDYTFDNLIPSSFPNNIDIRHSATIAGSYTNKQFKLAVGVDWHTGKPYTVPLEGEEIFTIGSFSFIQYDLPNSKRLSDYFRTNISAEYRFKFTDKIESKVNVAIINVLNRKNTLNTRYALGTDDEGNLRINQIEEVSLGFSPNFSLQILF